MEKLLAFTLELILFRYFILIFTECTKNQVFSRKCLFLTVVRPRFPQENLITQTNRPADYIVCGKHPSQGSQQYTVIRSSTPSSSNYLNQCPNGAVLFLFTSGFFDEYIYTMYIHQETQIFTFQRNIVNFHVKSSNIHGKSQSA